MIIEQRDYHVYTGKLNELIEHYAQEGIDQRHRQVSPGKPPEGERRAQANADDQGEDRSRARDQ